MRAYISVAMEGIAGISHAGPTRRGDLGYATAVALMEGETNAAIAGAYEGGATEVLVNDSHGSMYDLAAEAIDRRAGLVQGRKPWSMVEAAPEGSRAGRGPRRGLRRTGCAAGLPGLPGGCPVGGPRRRLSRGGRRRW